MDIKIRKIVVLESKLRKVENAFSNAEKEKAIEMGKLEAVQGKGEILKKEIEKLSRKVNALKKKVDIFTKKESLLKAQKKEIEKQETQEKNLVKKRKIEKERWFIEEKRRKVEEEKWKAEDLLRSINTEIRDNEEKVNSEIKNQERRIILKIQKFDAILRKNESWKVFLKQKIAVEKENKRQRNIEKEKEKVVVEAIRTEAKRRGVEIKREKEEKTRELQKKLEEEEKQRSIEKEKERVVVEAIRAKARKREEEIQREKEEKTRELQKRLEEEERKIEMDERFKELFEVIAQNNKEIDSLKRDLEEKEKNREQFKGKENEDERHQADIIRERIKEEKEKLKLKEKLTQKENHTVDFSKEEQSSFKIRDYQSREKDASSFQELQREKGEVATRDEKVQKLTYAEAEALFKKAEKSYLAGSMQIAKARFQRIVDNYYPEEQKGILSKIGKTLDVRAGEYINKIETKKEREQVSLAKDVKKDDLIKDLYQERRGIEEDIQDVLTKRKEIEANLKEAEKNENLQELSRLSYQFEDIDSQRRSLERRLGESIEKIEDIKDNPYTSPVIVREVVRERIQTPSRESISGEIKKIMAEKELIEKEIESVTKKKEEEKKRAREIKRKERELQEEKIKLEKKEEVTDDEQEKEEIRKRKEEMESELRRLIAEETTEKWEKRIREVENEVMQVSRKYEELTRKEETLRQKVKEIDEWGPERRKKEKDIDIYRSLYRKSIIDRKEQKTNFDDYKTEKSSKTLLRTLTLLKPSKDFFLKPPLLVAIDISDYSVEVFVINDEKMVVSFGRIILEEGVVYHGEIRDAKKLEEKINDVFKKTKPTPIIKKSDRRIKGAINLPESKVFIQQVKVKENENVLNTIREEIKRAIPISIDDLYFHYYEIFLSENKERTMFCVAVEKRIVNEYINLLRDIDVDPIVFDLEAASLGRCLLAPNKESKTSEMIVDIGARSSNVSIFYEQTLSFSVSIPFGGAYFTEKIAKELKISIEEAEERKKKLGMRGQLKSILSDSLEKIVREIREAEKYYSREIGGEIKNIIIVGGSSLIPGILNYFKSELGDIVSMGRPSQKIKTIKELDEKESLIYANVIGLALRITGENSIENGINILPEEIKKLEKRYQQERKRWVWIISMILATVGILALFWSLYYAYKIFSS